MAKATTSPTPTPLRGWKARGGDRKSTRLNSSHTVIYTLSLHDALPISRGYNAGQVIRVPTAHGEGNYVADADTIARLEGEGRRSEEHTSELQSHRDLHSFPTRRSSDLPRLQRRSGDPGADRPWRRQLRRRRRHHCAAGRRGA